ncbi:hypothetical protein D7V97_32430 [Corallococcus sp. CA053C]|uniref:hypothetical protein n=1 Tax=Corallococcus sp. CA053C TaxID=2316732 RepID=UPI000EA12F4E|nr:hypothetical protein [Corallococcus sp. CA053C]RKG98869.1 hypothetical protein D7V97_32430 [Corallococcus sp. CA053C]
MSAPSNSPRRRHLLLGGGGASALVLVVFFLFVSGYEGVLFVNGLDVPVQVSVDGEPFELASGGHVKRHLRTGLREVDVRAGEAPLVHDTVYVTHKGQLVYNVLGAAPLFWESIHYTSSPQGDASAPPVQPLAGTPWLQLDNVDFALTDPPTSISMRKEDRGSTTRTHLGLAPGGWKTSVNWLLSTHHPAEADRLARAVLRALPETPWIHEGVIASMMALEPVEGVSATVATARALRDADPEDYGAQRMWMHQMRRAGRNEEARAYYAAALAREPGSVMRAVLLARTEPGPQATARLEALRRAHPGEHAPRWGLASRYVSERRWAEALVLLDAMEQDEDPRYPLFQDTHAQVLVALGRREEAARRLTGRLLGNKDGEVSWDDVLLYARLVGQASLGTEASLLRNLVTKAAEEERQPVLRALLAASLGEPVPRDVAYGSNTQVVQQAVWVLTALPKGAEAVAGICANLDAPAFIRVGTEASVLLAGEFERLGDSALAARTLEASGVDLSFAELRDAVRGTRTVDSLEALDLSERAALQLVVARRLEASGANADKAYALVKRDALLPGPVTVALERWPRPGASRGVAGAGVP